MASFKFAFVRYRAVKFATFIAKDVRSDLITSPSTISCCYYGVILANFPKLDATIYPGRPKLCEFFP